MGEREEVEGLGWRVLWREIALFRREETVLRLLEDVRETRVLPLLEDASEMREERFETKRRRALRGDRWSVLECPLSIMLM